jgi:hypothetical protein
MPRSLDRLAKRMIFSVRSGGPRLLVEIRRVLGSGELLLTQQPTAELRFREFFSSIFENWQSEFLQLVCQAVLQFLGLIPVEREG